MGQIKLLSETKFILLLRSPPILKVDTIKKVGMDYQFWAIIKMAAIKMWKSRFMT